MHLHILGICGTFMAGVALLAKELGHRVSGSDARVYPPMSTQLAAAGIHLLDGYDPAHLDPPPDLVIIGNALSRGNVMVETILDRSLAYISGPQWLAENVLRDRCTIAVAGTHGKTTTASILAWLLERAGVEAGFLIGGVPTNFGVSARLGTKPYFVVEADEYDTAFFDKRSKFVHYRPRIAVLTNLEFDHADIFQSIEEIRRQFHHLVRTIPSTGRIVFNGGDHQLSHVLEMGCWTPLECFVDANQSPPPSVETVWCAHPKSPELKQFDVMRDDKVAGSVTWPCIGHHNMQNALAAIAAAYQAGVSVESSCGALEQFQPVKRRLELIAQINGISVYDDFAHHPTAIRETIKAMRAQVGTDRIVAVLEPRSNSMRAGAHCDNLASSLAEADQVIFFGSPELQWNAKTTLAELRNKVSIHDSVDAILEALSRQLKCGDHAVIMSNGDFAGLHRRLVKTLETL